MAFSEKSSPSLSRPLLGGEAGGYNRWSSEASSLSDNLHFNVPKLRRESRWRRVTLVCALLASCLLNTFFVLSSAYLWSHRGVSNPIFPQLLYSPVNDLIKYKVQKFTSGFGSQRSKYQDPPSKQKDLDWEDLYVEAFTIPKSQAALQPNKTIPVSDAPDAEYITSFSVMHYLHCLDMVRRSVDFFYYPDHYGINATHNPYTLGLGHYEDHEQHGMLAIEHVDHCIDAIRQALMCQVDLSPVVWQWDRSSKSVKVWAQTVHTCRNYDDIKAWAEERRWTGPFEQDKHLEDAGRCGAYDPDDCNPEL